jgi:hypothetical protein
MHACMHARAGQKLGFVTCVHNRIYTHIHTYIHHKHTYTHTHTSTRTHTHTLIYVCKFNIEHILAYV